MTPSASDSAKTDTSTDAVLNPSARSVAISRARVATACTSLRVSVRRENEYYAAQSRSMTQLIQSIGLHVHIVTHFAEDPGDPYPVHGWSHVELTAKKAGALTSSRLAAPI